MDIVCGDINKILDVVSKEFFFSVNISNGQLKDKDIVYNIRDLLDKNSLEGSRIKIEITENTAINDVKRTLRVLREFKKLGIDIFIDDFGSGYSSFRNLKKFPKTP